MREQIHIQATFCEGKLYLYQVVDLLVRKSQSHFRATCDMLNPIGRLVLQSGNACKLCWITCSPMQSAELLLQLG